MARHRPPSFLSLLTTTILTITTLLTLLPTPAHAITILDIITSTPTLSSLSTRLSASKNLTALFTAANNFTFLAPSNNALSAAGNLTDDEFDALLRYALVEGLWPTLNIQNAIAAAGNGGAAQEGVFVSTNLVNESRWANVTGGQRVELSVANGEVEVFSGDRSVSRANVSDLVCIGGIVHIMDTVLKVPVSAVYEITDANLSYFISILSAGNFLVNPNSSVYVNAVLGISDVTFFIPNSPGALANFTAIFNSVTPDEQRLTFEYHVIPGVVAYSPDLTNNRSLKSAQGSNLTITVQGNDTFVNAAKIISSDYLIANGVIHVIDSLLNYTNTAGPPPAASTSSTSTTPTTTPTPSPTSSSSGSSTTPAAAASGKSSNKNKTIGIAVGVTLGVLALIAAALFFFFRNRHSARETREAALWNSPQNNVGGVPYEGRTGSYYVKDGKVARHDAPPMSSHHEAYGSTPSPVGGGAAAAAGQGLGVSTKVTSGGTAGGVGGGGVSMRERRYSAGLAGGGGGGYVHREEAEEDDGGPMVPQRSPGRTGGRGETF